MMEAKLVLADRTTQQKAYVENISERGARVYVKSPRELGEQLEIIPATGEGPLRGDVIYCRRVEDGRFAIGLNLRRSPVLFSLVQKLKS